MSRPSTRAGSSGRVVLVAEYRLADLKRDSP